MIKFITADQVRLGDVIKCICEQGCARRDQCQNCPNGCSGGGISCGCMSNPCNKPTFTWERVIRVLAQPSIQNVWLNISLTHHKEFGTWAKSLIIKYVP